MKFYQDGKITVTSPFYEEAVYHVSNEKISVVFDGKGGLSGYSVADQKDCLKKLYLILFRKGKPIDLYCEKKVEMIGRMQRVELTLKDASLTVLQFVDPITNGVFFCYEFVSDVKEDAIEVGLSFFATMSSKLISHANNCFSNEEFTFASKVPARYESENKSFYFTLKANQTNEVFFSFGLNATDAKLSIEDFDTHEALVKKEIQTIKLPKSLNEAQKALFYSAYFCSLQNFKQHGNYQAFMAGHHYLLPMRSYYRDSYFTVLPMYRNHSDKVRAQIITLANGISENGDCPSAVKSDFSEWWGNHYDSPSFLAMMLYDYLQFSKDSSILTEAVKNTTVFGATVRAIEKLSSFADQTHLLYKEGRYNKRDWADEVNRSGYVTYNEILYARALFCIAKLYEFIGEQQKAQEYAQEFQAVKQAINDLLWDEELGYYVNFKDRDYTEQNLSVDTCFAAIFGIADDQRAIRLLESMERLLETKNNQEQSAGDFGVMCVYPFYGRVDGAYLKSSQPFYYHNGANWPYLSAMYAYAKRKYGMEYRYALESWFDYNVQKGNYTPVEFFSPPQKDGSLLQAWCGDVAFVMDEEISRDFWN